MSEQNDPKPSNQLKEEKTSPDEELGELSINETEWNRKPGTNIDGECFFPNHGSVAVPAPISPFQQPIPGNANEHSSEFDHSEFTVQKVKLENNSYRQLSARWQDHVDFSGQYLVLLHEQIGNQITWKLCEKNRQTECSIKFSQLKCEHNYYCEVIPEWGECCGKATESEVITTGKRKRNTLEAHPDFGKTDSIKANFRDKISGQDMEMDIHWHPVIAGTNHDLINYELRVVREHFENKIVNAFVNVIKAKPTIFEKKQLKDASVVTVPNIKPGQKYIIYVVTLLKNLDTDKIERFEHSITENTKLGKLKMNDKCECTDDAFIFHWNVVPGSVCYELVIWDENPKDIWFQNRYDASPEKGKDFSAFVTKRDKIRSGQTCNVKVISIAANELRSESEAKRIFLGDAKQPKNVQAVLNPSNIRCANISFDQPSDGTPIQYKIFAVPADGRGVKEYFTNTTPYVCEYLRTITPYTFEVSAKWVETWSRKSKSNRITTQENTNTGIHGRISMLNTQATTATVDASRSQFNQYNLISDDVNDGSLNFGNVWDFQTYWKASGEKDNVTVTWTPPSFGKNHSNYRVLYYNVHVQRGNVPSHEKIPVDGKKEFSKEIELELGHKYEIRLESYFENIDAVAHNKRWSETKTVYSRPVKPVITKNEITSDKHILEWNDAKGAIKYKVMIYVENSQSPIEKVVEETQYETPFDESFGYGKHFHAKVFAYGENDVENSCATDRELIGGPYVPTNVSADNRDVSDPTTEISVRWIKPQIAPDSYEIEAHARNNEVITRKTDVTSSFLFNNLKGGTKYRFKVVAIHAEKKRFGCWSNEQKTSPKPMKVKGVQTKPGQDPTTSIEIHWNAIQQSTTEITYRVNLNSNDYEIKKDRLIKHWVCMTQLPSGTQFSATVAAHNSEGYGEESEIVHFDTEHERPRNVKLMYCDKDMPTHSLQLNFESTHIAPSRYEGKLYLNNTEEKTFSFEPGELPMCSYTFNDLQPYSEYRANVRAVFASGKSAAVPSNWLKTAPAKPLIKRCERHDKEGCGSREILAQWSTDMEIQSHEVRFRLASTGQLEKVIAVKAMNELVYDCHHESTQYLVDVRSQNALGQFGEWSDYSIVSLAPAKLKDIIATLEGDGISVTCNTAHLDRKLSARYFMKAVCNNEVLPGDIIPCNNDRPIVKWNYTPDNHAEKYQFQLWAEYQQEDEKYLKGEIATSNTVISKPMEGEAPDVELIQENPSMDIKISWRVLENCEYQVRICDQNGHQEIVLNTGSQELHCKYRCQIPGSVYKVSVRGVRESVQGNWSAEKSIALVPAEVKFKCEQPSGPVNAIELKWHDLEVPPKKYIVRLMCGDEMIQEFSWGSQANSQIVEKPTVHPGRFYRCEIAGSNDAGIGRFSSSRTYHIIWDNPEYLEARLDDDEPSNKAIITWDKPNGIERFDLHIKSLDKRKVHNITVSNDQYMFESGTPGTTYNVELRWGYHDTISPDYLSTTFTMKPSRPWNIRATGQCDGLLVSFDDDPSSRKSYEISVESPQFHGRANCVLSSISPIYVSDLTPGASYIVSITTIINDKRSLPGRCNHIVQTLPSPIENLEPTCMDDHVIFIWDVHQFSPRYFVQWRVDNGPILDSETSKNSYTISPLKPSSVYFLRVAVRNTSGDGEMTDWNIFYSRPDPPRAVLVSKDPKRSTSHFIIKIEDEIQRGKSYQIELKPFNKPGAQNKSIVTSKLRNVVGDLRPGTAYKVYVKSIFHDKESNAVEGISAS